MLVLGFVFRVSRARSAYSLWDHDVVLAGHDLARGLEVASPTGGDVSDEPEDCAEGGA